MQRIISKEEVLEMIKRTGFARHKKQKGKEGDRYYLQGITVSLTSADTVQAACTDGHRMAMWDETGRFEQNEDTVLIQEPVVEYVWSQRGRLLAVVVDPDGDALIEVRTEQGKAKFDLDHCDPPPIHRILPISYDFFAEGEVDTLREGLVALKKQGFEEIFIFVEEGHIKVRGHHGKDTGENSIVTIGEVLRSPTNPDGEGVYVGMNRRYLHECINSLPRGGDFEIRLLGENEPVVVEDIDTKHVLMPMRITPEE